MKLMIMRGANIPTTSNTMILKSYYIELGVTSTTTFGTWMHGIATHKYPAYGSVTRAIRKARENNPQWRKLRATKQKQVEDVKEEVGYAHN